MTAATSLTLLRLLKLAAKERKELKLRLEAISTELAILKSKSDVADCMHEFAFRSHPDFEAPHGFESDFAPRGVHHASYGGRSRVRGFDARQVFPFSSSSPPPPPRNYARRLRRLHGLPPPPPASRRLRRLHGLPPPLAASPASRRLCPPPPASPTSRRLRPPPRPPASPTSRRLRCLRRLRRLRRLRPPPTASASRRSRVPSPEQQPWTSTRRPWHGSN
ncbi:hypothetical protein GUJ93_ZPchr0006g44413 [Zizania palustris]|uniref:Uncharacterized protein n=1 Tax=Zizania palustris TaxID=103762 RepID=A0A8J5VGJ5_ZIZPA|nr:hypothetical protein GUJ93_ZPchr0006g44413 [Zizania palustris]